MQAVKDMACGAVPRNRMGRIVLEPISYGSSEGGCIMTDVHIHIERGPYTKEWIDKFVKQAVNSGMDKIYLLEHSHRFVEFAPMYVSICEYSDYQKNWYQC